MVKVPKFSLLIPTFNRKRLLQRCLEAATSQDYPDYEVIVIDDASTDGTAEMVCRFFPQVRHLRQKVNQGPAAARNRGIREATGELIAFTDDDCLLPSDFLSRLAAGYQEYPEVAGVGGYLDPPAELLRTNLWARYEFYVTHQVYRAGSEPYLGGVDCPAGGTNSMSYRRKVLEEVGGFDESFPFAGGEDTDLKWRVVSRGYSLLYVPVRVIHLRSYSLRNFWRQYQTHGRGVVHFERKHKGHPPTYLRMILRGGVRLLRWGRDLFRLGPELATAKLVVELADVVGQWREVRRLRCQ